MKVTCSRCGRHAADCYFRDRGGAVVCKSPSGCRRRREFQLGLDGKHERPVPIYRLRRPGVRVFA